MLLSSQEAQSILDRALSHVKADEAELTLSGGSQGNLRFARNMPTTTGNSRNTSLTISCVLGKRVGEYTTTDLDDASIAKAVARAQELARLSPESPEYMPRLGPQSYLEVPGYEESTAKLGPAERAQIAAGAIQAARKEGLEAAGYYENGESFTAMANTKGLTAYHRETGASYTLTVRSADGNGSGWAAGESFRAGAIDSDRITRRAMEKALGSRNPTALDPGTYPVILEPSAVGDMVKLFRWSLGRRGADEGRSYFADPTSGTKLGQKLFDDRITIYSDPTDPAAPSIPWGEDGLPLGRTMWVERGVVRNLATGRYWAQQKGLQPIPFGSNTIMTGEEHSLDDLVAATDFGLLVTSFWYIREVDPRSILYTGLTRDGLFLIEKGKIVRPVNNFRWNESPAAIFKGVEMMSRPERIVTREGNQPTLAPAMKVREFHFTSVSTST